MSNVIDRVKKLLPTLPATLKRIANVVIDDPEFVVKDNLNGLAIKSKTSDAAVVRFAKRVGYKGFRDLQISLAYELGDSHTQMDQEIGLHASIETIVNVSSNANIHAVTESREFLNYTSVEKVINIIKKARIVHIFAQGINYSTGIDLSYNLMKLGILCNVYNDSYMHAVAGAISSPDDVALAISHRGSNKEVIESLTIARQHHAKTIALTTRVNSPITKIADISLCVAEKEIVFQGEPLTSRMSMMHLVDILFLGIAANMDGKSLQRLKEVKEVLNEKRDPIL
ncbi:MurR/RpiR family transcriptional regulator [Bacillus sp. Marseille-P3661]|uniref:MurR/RpiR family transcriptional regulator n=1 Tax=Bacillus sp. Marseille-P3661 TaxID=1936234 RepID=UPI000C832086|nr:MurR/RpiR family transcriptional regulator [Bacillus sp. Marseille-P3661]